MHVLTDLLVVYRQEEISHSASDKKHDTKQNNNLEGKAAFGPHERPQHYDLAPYSPPRGLTHWRLCFQRLIWLVWIFLVDIQILRKTQNRKKTDEEVNTSLTLPLV